DPASARCGSIGAHGAKFLSWLALDREVLVVSQVDAVTEQALDERSDEPEVHQQRDVDVSQPPRVVGWTWSGHGPRLGRPTWVRDEDVDVHRLRGGRIGAVRVRLVVERIPVSWRQAVGLGHTGADDARA